MALECKQIGVEQITNQVHFISCIQHFDKFPNPQLHASFSCIVQGRLQYDDRRTARPAHIHGKYNLLLDMWRPDVSLPAQILTLAPNLSLHP